jgi:predicted ATPase
VPLPAAPFVRSLRFRDEAPADIPALAELGTLVLDPRVTFLAGENGSGKSTLVEALAVALRLNVEGGGHTQMWTFSTRPSHAELRLVLDRAPIPPVNTFFLRAESFYNFASAAEHLPLEDVYDRPLHEQSHGESFLALVLNRFGPRGFYLLDEPEAALSVRGQLALMRRMHDLVEEHSQFVVATHSPILLGFPGATIYQLDDDGTRRVDYEDTDQYALTKSFLEDRDRFLHYLLADD